MSLEPLQDPFTRRHFLPNTMNFHGDWNNTTQYYKFDVVVCPTALSSYILTGKEALIGGGDPSTNSDWEELSAAATGVLSVSTTGPGLANVGTATNVNLQNTGITSLSVSGAGLSSTGGTTPTLTNTGVVSVSSGNAGITISGASSTPVISNNGLLGLTAGSGIVATGATNAPILFNTRMLEKFIIPGFNPLIAPGPYTGSTAQTLGSFTMPADAVPGSTAMLYSAGWAVNAYAPLPPAQPNVLDYRLGFSATANSAIGDWFSPAVGGFQVASQNANSVPLSIPALPHTPANITNPDYVQLPTWIALDNIQPSQTIYLNIEIPYSADTISGIQVAAPFLLYMSQ